MAVASLASRLRHGRLAPLRRRLPAVTAAAATVAAGRGHRWFAAWLAAVAAAGYGTVYARARARGRAATAEHRARMGRLRLDVLTTFYITCIGSMEAELEEYPRYDRRKHEMRYRILARLATRHAPPGATVVDVGCASALVLDLVRAARGTRGVGFDLSPFGLRQRASRADPPLLARAVVENMPLGNRAADVVVFSEVIEHLVDAYAGLREVGRVCRPGGTLVLTTNNACEMPTVSPLRDPLSWVERVAARNHPGILAFRNLTWHDPINESVDPLPRSAPTYVPHIHFTGRELRELAADAGFDPVSEASFEFPAPQSRCADWLRSLSRSRPRLGDLASDGIEAVCSRLPGVRMMGTHHEMVFRKVREPRAEPVTPWWPRLLVPATPDDDGRAAPSPATGAVREPSPRELAGMAAS